MPETTSIVDQPQTQVRNGIQYVFDPVTGKWKAMGRAVAGGNVRQEGTSIVQAADTTQDTAVTQDATSTSTDVEQVADGEVESSTGSQASTQQSAATEQPASLLSGLNFEEELKKLLAADPRVAELERAQYESIQRDLQASDFGPEDQHILDAARQSAQIGYDQSVAQGTQRAQREASAMGLRESSNLVRDIAREVDQASGQLAQSILNSEVAVRVRAMERGGERRAAASVRARDFASAIQTKNVELAKALLQAHQTEVEAGLSQQQLDLQRRVVDENISLSRDRFTEEQRAAMKAEGFTEQQITRAEEQALWERSYRERQQMADIGLAQQNYDLQNRQVNIAELRNAADISLADRALQLQTTLGLSAANIDQQKIDQMKTQLENEFNIAISGQELQRQIATGQLNLATLVQQQTFTMAERQQQMAEIRNNADISLADRTFELQERMQLTAADLEGAKFKAYVQQLEREYGLQLNEFALKDTIATGQLNLDILNSQRKYDLDVTSQKNDWLKSQAALQLQEKLGMADIELRQALGEGQLSVQREQQLLEKYMFEQGLAWDKEKLRIQIAEARKKAKGGLFGKILKTIVGGAVGFITGGPVGAVIGAASTILGKDTTDQIMQYDPSHAGPK